VLREQLDRLWSYTTRDGVARFLFGWLKALRWQRLPEMETLGDTLVNHFDGIAAYCDHPMRFSTDGDYAMLTKHPQRAGAY
jgi:transposase